MQEEGRYQFRQKYTKKESGNWMKNSINIESIINNKTEWRGKHRRFCKSHDFLTLSLTIRFNQNSGYENNFHSKILLYSNQITENLIRLRVIEECIVFLRFKAYKATLTNVLKKIWGVFVWGNKGSLCKHCLFNHLYSSGLEIKPTSQYSPVQFFD